MVIKIVEKNVSKILEIYSRTMSVLQTKCTLGLENPHGRVQSLLFSDYVGVADQVHTWFGNHMVEYSPCIFFVRLSVCPILRCPFYFDLWCNSSTSVV